MRVSVEPYSMATSTNRPPPMISQRGAICGASRAASTLPVPSAAAERDEADAGPQRRITHHVLDVEADHHGQRQQAGRPPGRTETNVITRLRLSNTENGTSGLAAVRSTMRKARKKTAAATPAPITHGSTQARGGPWVNTSTADGAAERGQQRAGDVELESLVMGLADPVDRDRDDDDANRHVDEERQPPPDHGERTAEHRPERNRCPAWRPTPPSRDCGRDRRHRSSR